MSENRWPRNQYSGPDGGLYTGPGIVQLKGICGENIPIWERILKEGSQFIVPPTQRIIMEGEFPAVPVTLEVGDDVAVHLPYNNNHDDCLLAKLFTRIGVYDSFGRFHWASDESIKKAKEQFKKDFPPEK